MSSEEKQGTQSIANHVRDCFSRFQNVSAEFATAPSHIRSKLLPSGITDELGRFRVWSGNVGAHRKGTASLDYKLREASHIRERVIELLQSAIIVLEEMGAIATGERRPWEELTDSDSDGSSSGMDDHKPVTELAQLLSNIAETNTCLMRLSMSIRNPAPHDQFKESRHIDFIHYETFDVDHAREKFPCAAEYLVLRVGKANSRRRQFLRYREEHRKKYEQGLPHGRPKEDDILSSIWPNTIAATSGELQTTVASSVPAAIKALNPANVLDITDAFDETLSQTSYASSNNDQEKLRPPPLPETGRDGQPFECPLCFRITSVRDSFAWRKHVFRDLQPYVCTFEQCDIPDHTYESRHEWFQHESQVHRGHWECVEGCVETFQSSEQLRGHLAIAHYKVMNGARLDDMLTLCYRTSLNQSEVHCSFCLSKCTSLLQLRQHLGKHQEQISLFALPSRLQEVEEGDEYDSDSEQIPSQSFLIKKPLPDRRLFCAECDLAMAGSIEQQLEVMQKHMTNAHVAACEPTSIIDFSRVYISGVFPSEDKPLRDGNDHTQPFYVQPANAIPRHVNSWEGLKNYLTGASKVVLMADAEASPTNSARSIRESVTYDIDDFEIPVNSGRSVTHFDDYTRNSAGLENLDWNSISDARQPHLADVDRLVEAHGGAMFLDKHRLWANLGYDLDFGRELTEPEASIIRATNVAHTTHTVPVTHSDAPSQLAMMNDGHEEIPILSSPRSLDRRTESKQEGDDRHEDALPWLGNPLGDDFTTVGAMQHQNPGSHSRAGMISAELYGLQQQLDPHVPRPVPSVFEDQHPENPSLDRVVYGPYHKWQQGKASVAEQSPLHVETNALGAYVLQTLDGRFVCSDPGCSASYMRVGDCRRHLKKHNGPFFPCTQRGCKLEFYRHDKLRAHMQQVHGITIPAPGNRRRQRGVVAG